MWLYTQFTITAGPFTNGTGQGLVNLDQVMAIDPVRVADATTETWELVATLADGSHRRLLGTWADPGAAFNVARAPMLAGPGVGNAQAMQTGNAS